MDRVFRATTMTTWTMIGFLMVSMAGLSSNLVASQSISQQFLDPHNAARSDISGANITNYVWNTTLATYAQSYADTQASAANNCTFKHSGGPYGENIFWAHPSSTPLQAVTDWVSEKQYYNYTTNSCAPGKDCQHYTQVIWKESTDLGCGSAACPSEGIFTVCSYSPAGNSPGQKPY